MPRAFVVNASPLILLARIQRLELLTSVAAEIIVPQGVMGEVEAGEAIDSAGSAVREVNGIRLVPDLPIPEAVRVRDLGLGESQVLAWCQEQPGTEALLDDRAARNCARELGIPTLGTLGLVLTCRRLKIIPAARPILIDLQAAGMRLKPALLEGALAKVGEAS